MTILFLVVEAPVPAFDVLIFHSVLVDTLTEEADDEVIDELVSEKLQLLKEVPKKVCGLTVDDWVENAL